MRRAVAGLVALQLALALPAQDPKKPDPKKPDPKKPDAKKPAEPERPKDDAVTAKDPAIVAVDKLIKDKAPSKKRPDWRAASSLPPKLPFDPTRDYFWHLRTGKGEIVVKLLPASAPQHVSSTVYLARLGFYDGLVFHRVMAGFMAQGGSPSGDGLGNAGYAFGGEFDPALKHDKEGKVSSANGGPEHPNTDGSQFFITFAAAEHLDGKHTIFGEVVSGMDAVKALEAAAGPDEKPKERLAIEATWIVVAAGKAAPSGKDQKTDKGGKGERRAP